LDKTKKTKFGRRYSCRRTIRFKLEHRACMIRWHCRQAEAPLAGTICRASGQIPRQLYWHTATMRRQSPLWVFLLAGGIVTSRSIPLLLRRLSVNDAKGYVDRDLPGLQNRGVQTCINDGISFRQEGERSETVSAMSRAASMS
jgi:hypothetical protein